MESPCKAMTNVNLEYMLSGDCVNYCTCSITGKRCIGVVIDDPDDASSRFVSRAKNIVENDRMEKCPCYGLSKETLAIVMREKIELKIKMMG